MNQMKVFFMSFRDIDSYRVCCHEAGGVIKVWVAAFSVYSEHDFSGDNVDCRLRSTANHCAEFLISKFF